MVIVASAKALPKSKKKALASTTGGGVTATGNNSSKKSGESSNNSKNASATASNSSKFPRPAPPRALTVTATSLVGGGRGKVKTTRNNTLPLPSPKSGLLASGPRIHAQRKFAQGACTTFGSSGLSSVHANYSPAVTPTKDGNKFRKRVLTPISPPLKRPKTEDFLTFLCFRGTPALPPELDYFNYSQPLQVDEIQLQAKKLKDAVVSVSTGVGSTNTDVAPPISTKTSQIVASISSAAASVSNGVYSHRNIANVISNTTSSTSTAGPSSTGIKNGNKPSIKSLASSKRSSPSVTNVPKKNQIIAEAVVVVKEKVLEQGNIGNLRKDNGGLVQKKAVTSSGKATTKKATVPAPEATSPQISPSTSRINEQDAKFAMTALKLKYQEKRLASVRPAKSLITMLTKKVKERSMVLTRSRAKTAVGPLKTSPLQRKRNQPVARPSVKPLPRNAPSPDIILGVAHSPVKPLDSKRSSSSESDSSSEESKKSSSNSSSSSSSESEDDPEPTTRSLRSGKEVVTKPKSGNQLTSSSSTKKSSPTRRMGTRATHRHTKSPLRELPMWNVNVKKKKILAKYKKNSAKVKANMNKKPTNNVKGQLQSKSNTGHMTRSSLRKSSGFNKGRPSRKTKETAAIYLGLLNKDFSSDDDESNAESDEEDRASSVGDTSSSETKFLEKQYNASLKRTNTGSSSSKKKDGKYTSTSSRLRSHQQQNQKSSKSEIKKSSKSSERSKSRERTPQPQKKKKQEEKPMPRVLRSRSSGSVDSNSKLDSRSAAERRRILLMTCGKNTAGAARKSAKVVSRGRRSRNYSSSDDDDGSEKSESSSDLEDDDEDEDKDDDDGDQSESQTDEEEEKRKPASKRDSTASPMSIPSSRGSRAKVKRVAELINESKGVRSPSSRRSVSSSPVGNRSQSESEDNKSIGSAGHLKKDGKEDEDMEVEDPADDEDEMEVEDDEEEEIEDEIEEDENIAETVEDDEEEGVEEDEEDDVDGPEDDDVVPSPVASIQESLKDNETEEPNEAFHSQATSPVHSNSTSPTGSSEAEGEEDEDDEDDTPEPPPKVSIAIQVDMDLEEEEEQEKLRQEEKRVEEEKRYRDAETLAKETSARTSSIELPLSEQQQAELREAQEEDDEIQEIGQVINNPSVINNNNNKSNHPRRSSPSPPIIPEPSHIHRPPPQQPEPVPLSIPLPLPPLTSRTSSLTYTSHHINLGASSVPFVPFSARPPATSDFFPPPPLHFGHTHLVNSVHLVGSSTTGHGVGVDFSSELTNPLSTLSIPVSVPTLPSFPNPMLPPAPPICLGPGGATMTATSLQTHIRTVATNLDIPLVRPVIGSADSSLPFGHLGMGAQTQLGSVPLLGQPPPTAGLLSRPIGPWSHTTPAVSAAAAAAAAEARSHYSAFRLPNLQPSASSGPTIGGAKDIMRSHASTLPVSIVHPRTIPQQQQQPLHSTRASHNHHHQVNTSTANGQQNLRDSINMHHHQHSTSSNASSASAYMQNYNPESIIRNLPNVSIVPKFDRSSVKTQLPSQKSSTCSSSSGSSSSSKKHTCTKGEESKKPGKKKCKPTTLPAPSSPLTVRKDSNPATYVGVCSKVKKKPEATKDDREKAPQVIPSRENPSPKQMTKFDKLLTVKQERPDTAETPPLTINSKTTSSSARTASPKEKGKSSPGPALIRLDQIKQEIIVNHSHASSSVRKTHSPFTTHRKTPDNSATEKNSEKSLPDENNKKSPSKKSTTAPGKKLQEAPTYHPTEQEFEDPLKYFDKIQPEAEKYGMARIVPPRTFRPECNVNDDMRFTAYNHYIHKMFKRWGPTVQETEAIKEHLKRSKVDVSSVPVIGGMEIDFSTLYQIVQSLGGLKEVIEKEKWADVADRMHIPKGTHDRAKKLDSVYVEYILPYYLLSDEERDNLMKSVQDKWTRRQQKLQERTDESSEDETSDEDSMDELDDCVIKGKGTPLSAYYRVARNTVGMIFPNGKEPSIQELEDEYWKIVREGKKHLCVYSGSIDCAGGAGWGFPVPKASAKHPWNLKVLANNAGSVLRSMGPVMGATVPTLHVSMLFTSYCWYRDPHGLPWVEYLHSGASKIWYSVAAAHEQSLRKALMKLMPLQCKNKKLWLPSDSAMVPPELLLENDVPLVRAVQNPGEFLVVFPKSYTSAICAGYLVSESVCFAPPIWLKSCMELFKDIRDSKEPPVFPIEKLLLSIVRDNRVPTSVIKMAAPLAEKVILEELALRKKLITMGVSQGGKPNKNGSAKGVSKKKKLSTEEEVEQCYFCNYILHMSLVRNERTDFVTCLPHAIQHLSRHKAQIKKCSLLCEETQEELESLLQTAKRRANP